MYAFRYWTLEIPDHLKHLKWKSITSRGTHLFTITTRFRFEPLEEFDAPTLRMTLHDPSLKGSRSCVGRIFCHKQLKEVEGMQYNDISAVDFWPDQYERLKQHQTRKLLGAV